MRRAHFTAIVLLLVSATAAAQRVRLDDSQSPVDAVPVDLMLQADAVAALLRPGAVAADQRARGVMPAVEVRLDTSDFVGRAARIFLTMPPAAADGSDLELRWEAQGRFLSGTAHPGQSTLVFEGQLEQPLTSAVFNFVLLVGERTGTQQNRMEIFYELEELP
jgi:hypothetical protein